MTAIGGLGTGRLAQLTNPKASSSSAAAGTPQRHLGRKPAHRKADHRRPAAPNPHRDPNHRSLPASGIEAQSGPGPNVLTIWKTLPLIDSAAKRSPLRFASSGFTCLQPISARVIREYFAARLVPARPLHRLTRLKTRCAGSASCRWTPVTPGGWATPPRHVPPCREYAPPIFHRLKRPVRTTANGPS